MNNDKRRTIKKLNQLHTTELGLTRIKKNLNISTNDVVEYLKNKILSANSLVSKKGKNYYCDIDNIRITINCHSFTIITAHTTIKNTNK